jgi:hypothetical protein
MFEKLNEKGNWREHKWQVDFLPRIQQSPIMLKLTELLEHLLLLLVKNMNPRIREPINRPQCEKKIKVDIIFT